MVCSGHRCSALQATSRFILRAGLLVLSFSSANSASSFVSRHPLLRIDGKHQHDNTLPAFGFSPGVLPSSVAVTQKGVDSICRLSAGARVRREVSARPCGGLTAQLPNLLQGLFGSEVSKDKQYHESRLSHHEERIKYHEERARHHRASLQTISREVDSGVFEERIAQKAQQEGRPVKLLFVDLANTCRSPAAEAIMKAMAKKQRVEGRVEALSCSTGSGTRDWFKDEVMAELEREVSDPRMVSHASKRGLNLAGRRSRAMTREDLTSADIIIGMDAQNKKDIVQAAEHWGLKGEATAKIRLLSAYCRSGTRTTDVPDPYYGGQAGQVSGPVFEKVLDLLEDGCKGLLRDLYPSKV